MKGISERTLRHEKEYENDPDLYLDQTDYKPNDYLTVTILCICWTRVQSFDRISKDKCLEQSKRNLKELVSKINEASLSLDYIESLDKMPVYSEDDIYESGYMYQAFIEKYFSFYNPINELYKGLLKFESEFSLSYGFDRYILYLREYLRPIGGLHDEIKKLYGYLAEDLEKKDYNGCMVDCGHLTEIMGEQIQNVKLLDSFIIKELRYKFSIDA